jgi:hypothetical protein
VASVHQPSDRNIIRVSPERMKELALVAKGGELSHENKAEIANGFFPLVVKIANGFSRGSWSKSDDFVSAGLFGVVKSLEKASEKVKLYQENEPEECPGVHLCKWIIANIKRMIHEFRVADHLVPVPARTINAAKHEGIDLKFDWSSVPFKQVHHDPRFVEVRELLTKAVKDDHDAEIVKLRTEGYNDYEIAEMMKVSKSYIHKKRTLIQERYNQLSGETW